MRVELHPEARSELRSAALWYEERRSRLGDQFVGRISAELARIGDSPAAYPIWPGTGRAHVPIRKAVVEQFPYLVAFEVHANRVLVLAVTHAKRKPLYWLTRGSQLQK